MGIASDLLPPKANFTPQQLLEGGFDGYALALARVPLKTLREMGVSAKDLKDADDGTGKNQIIKPEVYVNNGYTATELRDAGFTLAELKHAKANQEGGICRYLSANQEGGCFTMRELHDAGFNAKGLRVAGFSLKEVQGLGYDGVDLRKAGYTCSEFREGFFQNRPGRDVKYLTRTLGFTGQDIFDAGFSWTEAKGNTKESEQPNGLSWSELQLWRLGPNPRIKEDPNYDPMKIQW